MRRSLARRLSEPGASCYQHSADERVMEMVSLCSFLSVLASRVRDDAYTHNFAGGAHVNQSVARAGGRDAHATLAVRMPLGFFLCVLWAFGPLLHRDLGSFSQGCSGEGGREEIRDGQRSSAKGQTHLCPLDFFFSSWMCF